MSPSENLLKDAPFAFIVWSCMFLVLPFYIRANVNVSAFLMLCCFADRKSARYTDLDTLYSFQPVAVEMLSLISDSAHEFLFNLRHKISLQTGSDKDGSFLFQRISVLIQRFNKALEEKQ